MLEDDARFRSRKKLFELSESTNGDGWCIGDTFRDVEILEDGTLICTTQVLVPGGRMEPRFRNSFTPITKQQYRAMLETAREKGYLKNAGKYGQPTLEELEALGRE